MSSVRMKDSPSVVIKVVPVPLPQDHEPRVGDFLDYMNDMYMSPDQVELRTVCDGWNGLVQDAQNIRRYFQKALSEIPPE
ncbi:MAG: hypothetical protein OXE84_13770 [Rhodobacteraceae bacterium]|nr:hypothetical protein [Paracoccaceae bacterium]